MKKNIVIIGSTSAIAESTARQFAEAGDNLFLHARNRERLDTIAKDLEIRGASKIITDCFDITEIDKHTGFVEKAFSEFDKVDVVIIAHGILPDQRKCEEDFQAANDSFMINCTSVLSLLTGFANNMEQRKHGQIAVISSLAGLRGRQSNYVYGSAKAMLNAFLSGLRNRLHKSGINVLTILPGFVDTPMTRHMNKGLLWTSADAAGKSIYRAIENRKKILYVPWFWRYIMLLIIHIPEFIFVRLKL